jgi:predicted GNAT superfamily acetyltransferase
MLNQVGWDFNLTNSSAVAIDYHNYYTKLVFPTDVTFSGNSALPIAEYKYQDVGLKLKSNQRKILNASAGITYGTYFTGTKLSYNADIVFRKQPYAIITASYTHDEIILPSLSKKVILDLIGPKIEFSFTKNIFFTTFIQYNSQIKNVNINARFQWRFKPMSDLFIVYSDNYYSENFGEKNRGVVLKFVYWFNL